MSSRQKIFDAIDSERDYQVRRWGRRQPDGSFKESQRSVGDYLTFMRHYLNEADTGLSVASSDVVALEMLRKVVTLGVRCFEEHGIKPRDPNTLVVNGHDGLRS